jgi:hypothetical protein
MKEVIIKNPQTQCHQKMYNIQDRDAKSSNNTIYEVNQRFCWLIIDYAKDR